MAKPITPEELPALLKKRQKGQTANAFAASLKVSRQAYNKLVTGEGSPSVDILERLDLEPVLRAADGKLLGLSKLGPYLLKQQNGVSDSEAARKLGLSRQHYQWLCGGEKLPKKKTLEKLDMELLYRAKSK